MFMPTPRDLTVVLDDRGHSALRDCVDSWIRGFVDESLRFWRRPWELRRLTSDV